MFPLHTKEFPTSVDDLTQAIEASLQHVFDRPDRMVSIRADQYPNLHSLAISLDDAQVRSNPPRPITATAGTDAALYVKNFTINGQRISSAGAYADLRFEAHDVGLSQGRDSEGQIVLVPSSAGDGVIEIKADRRSIERLIEEVARAQAANHGVTIEGVTLSAVSRDNRAIDAQVQLRAKKMFFSAVVTISATLEIDENMTAKISRLTCRGDGPIGTLACGALNPHLQRLNGRELPLMALPLGGIQLRDVAIVAGEEFKVTARFGSP
jgi:hypothetical protein